MPKVAVPAKAPAKVLPEYENPPVSEVVVGIHFETPLPGFHTAHTGLFWHQVKDLFPNAQHATPVVAPGNELRWFDITTGLPLPRLWLISKDKSELIQLQGDCFFFNWRKQADADEYPRYAKIIANYDKALGAFLSFLKDIGLEEPKPMGCELTYVNHIPQGEAWKTIDDVASIFKDFRWSKDKQLFPVPKSLSWSCTFDLPNKAGTLTARLRQVARIEGANALRLELVCHGLGECKSLAETRDWFDIAHEWIVLGFSDLTTPEAQKRLWKRANG